jgi:hypothetical protein
MNYINKTERKNDEVREIKDDSIEKQGKGYAG